MLMGVLQWTPAARPPSAAAAAAAVIDMNFSELTATFLNYVLNLVEVH